MPNFKNCCMIFFKSVLLVCLYTAADVPGGYRMLQRPTLSCPVFICLHTAADSSGGFRMLQRTAFFCNVLTRTVQITGPGQACRTAP